MTQYETVYRYGIVVNQDEMGEADIAVHDKRIAALNDLSALDASRVVNAGSKWSRSRAMSPQFILNPDRIISGSI